MIEIYSKPNCKFCVAAKSLLHSKNIEFQEKTLDIDFSRDDIIAEFPLAKTFPIVVIDGEYIGGYEQLKTRI